MKLETIQKMNGVDTSRLQETVSNVKASPELGRFKFQIANRWIAAGERVIFGVIQEGWVQQFLFSASHPRPGYAGR